LDHGSISVDYTVIGGAKFSTHPSAMARYYSGLSLRSAGSAALLSGHGMSHDIPKPALKAFIPTNNKSSRNGTLIDMIVLHFTDGPSAQSAINTFLDPNSQVSAHYIVDRNGDLYQMVDDDDKAWHAKSANARSIGIEHVARGGDGMSPAQEATSIALIRWLIATYGIQTSNILGHRFAPGNEGTTDCPDKLFGAATEEAVTGWVSRNFG
jgi:N-acetyl-anhydromuramyl-L-alanine amidase AmpD